MNLGLFMCIVGAFSIFIGLSAVGNAIYWFIKVSKEENQTNTVNYE